MTDETIEPSLAENNGLTASGDAPSLAAASKSRDDIVERLEHENDCQLMTGRDFSDLLLDAANEIKRLRSRLQPAAAAVVTTGLEPDPNSSSGFRLSTPHSPAVSAIAQERDVGKPFEQRTINALIETVDNQVAERETGCLTMLGERGLVHEIRRLRQIIQPSPDYVMVPREPTIEMHEAAFKHSLSAAEGDEMNAHFVEINAKIYRAMIAAAPPSAPSGDNVSTPRDVEMFVGQVIDRPSDKMITVWRLTGDDAGGSYRGHDACDGGNSVMPGALVECSYQGGFITKVKVIEPLVPLPTSPKAISEAPTSADAVERQHPSVSIAAVKSWQEEIARLREALRELLNVPELADIYPEDRSEECWAAERKARAAVEGTKS